MTTKQCIQCKQSKPLTNFHKKSNSKDGKQSRCKQCNIERASLGYYKDPDKRIEYQKQWDSNNRHKRRVNLIMREYKVSKDEAERLESLKSCQICGVAFTDSRFRHVDHDHKTGRVRGVLCMGCNTGIGNLKDDVEILKKAIAYLAPVS